MTGEFDAPADSVFLRELTLRWEQLWPDCEPVGYLLRGFHQDRWVRFHSLPQSKRYADTDTERDEILRRHRRLLFELSGSRDVGSLVVIAQDWPAHDLASGWSRTCLPNAWPWRIDTGEDSGTGTRYFWVATDLAGDAFDALLARVADDSAQVVLAPTGLEWLYCPYDGGTDVVLPTTIERDALRRRHQEWLSAHPSGL